MTKSLPDEGLDAPRTKVTVVGGGLAGLVVARRLTVAGLDVELLEAGDQLGGCVKVLTMTDPAGSVSVSIDAGTESFSNSSTPVGQLIIELGLAPLLTSPSGGDVWLATARLPVRLPDSGFLGIPGTIPDVFRTCGWYAGARALIDHVLPPHIGIGSPDIPRSLGRVVRARLGRSALNRAVAPVVGNINLTDPNLLDVDSVAPGLRAAVVRHGSLVKAAAALRAEAATLSRITGLTGGFHQIVAALARDIIGAGGTIRTGVRVARAVPVSSGSGWRVSTLGPAPEGSFEAVVGSGAVDHLETDLLVFAGDADNAGAVLGPVLPGLPRAAVRGGINIMTLLLHAPALDSFPRGSSVLVTPDATRSTGAAAKTLTHVNAKWAWLNDELPAHTHVVRVAYGHLGQDPDVAEAKADSLARTALHDASLLLGARLTPQNLLAHDLTRYPPGLPFIAVGHSRHIARVRAAAQRLPGLHLTGAWISGTGVGPVITDANTVANEILAELSTEQAGAH